MPPHHLESALQHRMLATGNPGLHGTLGANFPAFTVLSVIRWLSRPILFIFVRKCCKMNAMFGKCAS